MYSLMVTFTIHKRGLSNSEMDKLGFIVIRQWRCTSKPTQYIHRNRILYVYPPASIKERRCNPDIAHKGWKRIRNRDKHLNKKKPLQSLARLPLFCLQKLDAKQAKFVKTLSNTICVSFSENSTFTSHQMSAQIIT